MNPAFIVPLAPLLIPCSVDTLSDRLESRLTPSVGFNDDGLREDYQQTKHDSVPQFTNLIHCEFSL